MKKFNFIVTILIFCLLTLSFTGKASVITPGGQFNTSLSAFYSKQNGLILLPQASLDLQLTLSLKDNEQVKCEGYFFTDSVERKLDFFWKKLYLIHRSENFHLSIGKQPISWSFGSLLNPVDYSLGAIAFDRDYSPKYQNALEIYYPINWNSSLTLVTSLSGVNRTWKAGLRGRTLIKGFDITANYVQEDIRAGEAGEYRIGTTAKGDLGPFGVYSALGYYSEGKAFSFLAGFDYSYFFPTGNQLYIQAEYLNIPSEMLKEVTGSIFTSPKGKGNIHLFAENITYKIDEFSSIGLTALYNSSTGSAIFMPVYNNQLSTNSEIRIQGGMQIKLLQQTEDNSLKEVFSKPAYIFLEIGLSYNF